MYMFLIIIYISVFCFSAAQSVSSCPRGGGFICYPNDCSNQYQRCSGTTFNDPEPTPTGLLCKNNQFVFPSSCSLSACPQPSCSLSQILSESDFDLLFPYDNGGATNAVANQYAIFNYSKLLAAAAKYPEFACTGTADDRRRELAAFLGQTSQETSGWWAGQPYNWGYYFSTEVGCTNDKCTWYCDDTVPEYPCAPGVGYFGRGPIQLSWNYNYGKMSETLFGDKSVLLENPDLLFSGCLAFESALWFWMTPQAPKPSCHDVMTGNWEPSDADAAAGRLPGYGLVTNIVNGEIECGIPTLQSTENRVQYYEFYASLFRVSPGPNLYCENMQYY